MAAQLFGNVEFIFIELNTEGEFWQVVIVEAIAADTHTLSDLVFMFIYFGEPITKHLRLLAIEHSLIFAKKLFMRGVSKVFLQAINGGA